ncbi:helix-turn-helix domain-containing protein [Anaerotignum lactatifermentans]|mgnify:CR=1 FL=1|uniref:helix-turn-helix domain-containing protein n=1 Tax=Anaerotignum lactatifermentans TaxID=160404 RepID=UPI00261A52A7|nr:XRE family transcriptional regulator [Anaerotignum lactatifermentans]
MEKKLIPYRIRQARTSRRMSISDLSEELEVSKQLVSQYETGKTSPSMGKLNEISKILKYPVSFFYKPIPKNESASSVVFFRSNKTAKVKSKNAAKEKMEIFCEIVSYLENYVNLPETNLPKMEYENEDLMPLSVEEIENYAMGLRKAWGLGVGPIDNLMVEVQKNGIHVSKISLKLEKIDAFSVWMNNKPYIFLNDDKNTNARIRFDIAHELGHLLMHADYYTNEDFEKSPIKEKLELEANMFAGAFLMPRQTFEKDVFSSSIDHFIQLKYKWKASIASMIYRCEALGILSNNQIKYLKDQMTKRSYWRREPLDNEMPVEKPFMCKQAIQLLLENNILTPGQISEDIGCYPEEIEEYCYLPKGTLRVKANTSNVISLKARV